ncbi:hypothetical protein EVAR_48483_1 [Eumeta japonica]|uniref:Uncharacterized protein n=1 Tax=Eumeta variegata TaxID=151549 RepID=A0A4C1XGU0_EUMVA|nr:hypothetical protein EVAR_48483_1 [Eumeta japonica]
MSDHAHYKPVTFEYVLNFITPPAERVGRRQTRSSTTSSRYDSSFLKTDVSYRITLEDLPTAGARLEDPRTHAPTSTPECLQTPRRFSLKSFCQF